MRRKTFLIALLLVVLPMALSTSAQDNDDQNQVRLFPQDGACIIGWYNSDNDLLFLDGEGLTVTTATSAFHLCHGQIPFGHEGISVYNFTKSRSSIENLVTVEQMCELRPQVCQEENALLFAPDMYQPGEVHPCYLESDPQTLSDDWLQVVDFDGNATYMCHIPASDD
jgi:hypothetical protein